MPLDKKQVTITTAVQGMVAKQAILSSALAAALATARGTSSRWPSAQGMVFPVPGMAFSGDTLIVNDDPKFTSNLFRPGAFTSRIGSSVLEGSAYHKHMRAFANGRKDHWNVWLPCAVFIINNSASTLGGELNPFFIDQGQRPLIPLSLSKLRSEWGTSPAYATALKQEYHALLYAAQQHRLTWTGSKWSSRWATR